MSNTLIKEVEQQYTPGSPGRPAYPGTPAVRLYTATEVVRICGPRAGLGSGSSAQAVGPGRSVPNDNPHSPDYGQNVWMPTFPPGVTGMSGGRTASGATSSFASGGSTCRDEYVTISYPGSPAVPPTPAIPPTPGQWTVSLNPGWNAAARSIDSLAANGQFDFYVRRNVTGAVVGFNESPDQSVSYPDIRYAWYFASGQAKVYEYGVLKTSYGAYNQDDKFTIRRRGSVVDYLVNDVVEYTSLAPSPDVAFFADVSLYLGGDYVYSPAFVITSEGEVSFEEMACFGGEGSGAMGTPSFEPMTAEGEALPRSAPEFEPLACFGAPAGHGGTVGPIYMEAMTSEGNAYGVELPPDYALGFTHFEPMQMYGFGHTAAGMDLSFEPLADLGTEGYETYGQGEVSFRPMIGGGDAYEGPNNATLWTWTMLIPGAVFATEMFVIMNTEITVGSTITAVIVEHVTMDSSITVTDTWLTTEQLYAIMQTVINAGFAIPNTNGESEVWVVNHGTGGSTMYEDFSFNAFAKIGENYYGTKEGGLYQLDGDDDDGDPIRASISFGKRDFFTPKMKRLSNAYFGLSASGRMFVRVVMPDGNSYTYATRGTPEGLAVQRADLGKGLRANYFQLELYNENGADFDLSTVEFVAATIERRI